jgi:hypothetical protein
VLADPQQALALLAVDPADPDAAGRVDPEDDPAVCVAEEVAYARPTPFGGIRARSDGQSGSGAGGIPGRRGGEAVIVLHLTDHDLLAAGPLGTGGVARSAKLGPVAMQRLAGWLVAAEKITIKPVLDLSTMAAVDQHDPPARMAQAVRLREETCVFPRCHRSSQRCDLDHIDPYLPLHRGGPPAQTRPANLAPLCRRHHRAKTFGGFSYRRLPDGSYQWTLPTGRTITTDPPTPRPRPTPRPAPHPHRRRPTPPC